MSTLRLACFVPLLAALVSAQVDSSDRQPGGKHFGCIRAVQQWEDCVEQPRASNRECYEAHYNSIRAACPAEVASALWDADVGGVWQVVNELTADEQ
ncbi:uncharacterized protein G6M90_00g061550 [Metarhizium brunneum]|uniref:Uncharacterized protein n=1 Tax=Metarhizium brunneum TaxID=500148 RepID=A0A7D5UY94_9HYPO|nr:hypothetical protein G6M90_00g061550 [Metarhizium brunneum]